MEIFYYKNLNLNLQKLCNKKLNLTPSYHLSIAIITRTIWAWKTRLCFNKKKLFVFVWFLLSVLVFVSWDFLLSLHESMEQKIIFIPLASLFCTRSRLDMQKSKYKKISTVARVAFAFYFFSCFLLFACDFFSLFNIN
jgi:hypothetical protein